MKTAIAQPYETVYFLFLYFDVELVYLFQLQLFDLESKVVHCVGWTLLWRQWIQILWLVNSAFHVCD